MGSAVQRSAPPPRQSQGSHCHICRKLIVWPGLCYTCATGRPRLIVRRDERVGEAEEYPDSADPKTDP
jgi:hypothetical protein